MRRPSSTSRKPAVPTVASLSKTRPSLVPTSTAMRKPTATTTSKPNPNPKQSSSGNNSSSIVPLVDIDTWIEEGDPLDILDQRRAAALAGTPMPPSRKPPTPTREDEDPMLEFKRPVDGVMNKSEMVDDGDEEKGFMANKPWLGAIYPPSTYIKNENNPHEVYTEEDNNWDAPEISLELDYCYGYRARDCRNNVHWVGNDRVVFPAAAVGVVLTVDTKKEYFYTEHKDDIMCMDYHEEKNLVASGSLGSRFDVQLCIWQPNKDGCTTKHVITGFHQFAVVSVAFNTQGTMVASVGLDEHHSVALHCVETGILLANSVCDKSRIVHCLFNKSSLVNSDMCFATIGMKHICFFEPAQELAEGKNYYALTDEPVERRLVARRGTGCKDIDSITFLSICFTSEHCVAGASNGMAYFFHARSKNVELVVQVGQSSPYPRLLSMEVITRANNNDRIVIGTSEGEAHFFKVFHSDRDHVNTGDITCEPDTTATSDGNCLKLNLLDDATNNDKPYMVASCRSLCWNPSIGQLLVGTILSHIYTLNVKASTTEEILFKTLVGGHWGNMRKDKMYGEVWGLDAHPTKQQIVSCADDGTVRLWDLKECKELARDFVDYPALKCSFSGDGRMVAVGHRNGGFTVLADDLDTKLQPFRRERTERVCDIVFSPNSKHLAVCSGKYVDIYRVDPRKNPATGEEELTGKAFTKVGTCLGHTSKVSALDWSISSDLIQVMSIGYELLYFDIPSCERLTGVRALADQIWFTQTCTIGWSVQGIWPRYSDGTDINSVAKSRSDRYLVTTDDWGKVQLFNYPCIGSGLDRRNGMLKVRPECNTYVGHASHVTNSVWTHDDSYLCTAGGQDLCVFSWKVNYGDTKKPRHFLNSDFIARHEQRKARKAAEEAELNRSAAEADTSQQPTKDEAGIILTNCYLCDYDYPDAIMKACPICNAPRKAVAHKLRRAWIDSATSRFRLPTSSFANYARNQLKFRKEVDSKEKSETPFIPMGRLRAQVYADEASNSDEEEEKKRPGFPQPMTGMTRMGTVVNVERPKKKKAVGPPKRKTTGPDFSDF